MANRFQLTKSNVLLKLPDKKRRRLICTERDEIIQLASQNKQIPTSTTITESKQSRWSLSYDDEAVASIAGGKSSCSTLAKAQPLYLAWRETESKIDSEIWLTSFENCEETERMRLTGIEAIFAYTYKRHLTQPTMHMAIHYMHILFTFYSRCKNAGRINCCLPKHMTSLQWLTAAVAVSIRTAVKMQERVEFSESFRMAPDHVWAACGLKGCGIETTPQSISMQNKIELLHMGILKSQSFHIPVACDFLDQYLSVGGWPSEAVNDYRRLALFLLALSFFSTGRAGGLCGTPPSKLAAAAVVLAVKIANTDKNGMAFEFWTRKLEKFTGYEIESLQLIIYALSKLLRTRQEKTKSKIFTSMFPDWASFSWS